ncbi:MAG: hypothetical protein DHS20C15_30970 [Planctomycetota bacterium]|nr:MAG: hypothetical protein DHS20C15_30970 [Planctomycetota bacterium]
MSPRICTALALSLFALPTALAAQSLTRIESFQLNELQASSQLSAVGKVNGTAGRYSNGSITLYPGVISAQDINPLGLSYAGVHSSGGSLHAMRFNLIAGWVPIPAPTPDYLFSNAFGISDDGTTVVGFAAFDEAGEVKYHAFRWNVFSGVEVLAEDTPGAESSARCISGDGNWVGGEVDRPGLPDRAVIWNAAGVMQEVLPASWPGFETNHGRVHVLNGDGTLAAGGYGPDAFLWSSTFGAIKLPSLPEFEFSMLVTGMADDGSVVVGSANYGDGPAWIWTPEQGTRLVRDIAVQLGFSLGTSPNPFAVVSSCTPDGLRIAGWEPASEDPQDVVDAWVIDLPEGGVGEWDDWGHRLSGNFTPALSGYGSLAPDSSGQLAFSGLPSFQSIGLFMGLTPVEASFKGGVLVPSPDLLKVLPTLFGGPSISFSWPAGLPSGTTFFLQGWVPDAGGPSGFAATNALRGITP